MLPTVNSTPRHSGVGVLQGEDRPDLSVVLLCDGPGPEIMISLLDIERFTAENPQINSELIVVVSEDELAATISGAVGGDVHVAKVPLADQQAVEREVRKHARGEQWMWLRAGEPLPDATSPTMWAPDMPLAAPDRGRDLQQRLEARGYTFKSSVNVHPETVIESPVWLYAGIYNDLRARIGAFSYSQSMIGSAVTEIGRYCSIAHSVGFGEPEHPIDWLTTSSFTHETPHQWDPHAQRVGKPFTRLEWPREAAFKNITIGNDVWVGARAYIKGGVSLGDGCIVGTGAIVTKDVPPYAVVAGNPGRVIKYRFSPDVIDELLELRWWELDFCDLQGVPFTDVRLAIAEIRRRKSSGEAVTYTSTSTPFFEILKTVSRDV